jgi:hypothetical protein
MNQLRKQDLRRHCNVSVQTIPDPAVLRVEKTWVWV